MLHSRFSVFQVYAVTSWGQFQCGEAVATVMEKK